MHATNVCIEILINIALVCTKIK